MEYVHVTKDNLEEEHICCAISNNRSAIASVNADYMNTELAIKTLNEALIKEKKPKNLILHSDQGA